MSATGAKFENVAGIFWDAVVICLFKLTTNVDEAFHFHSFQQKTEFDRGARGHFQKKRNRLLIAPLTPVQTFLYEQMASWKI